MGSRGSKPAGPPPPVYIPSGEPRPRRVEDAYPVQQPIGIAKGTAQGCVQPSGGVCQLAVPHGVSSSGAKLYRDQGTIRRDQCRRYANDLQKVANNQKSFEEVKKDLIAGLYYEELSNGYCRQITYAAEDLKAVLTPDALPADRVRYPSIRAMSDSGSYSSVTKLFIKPSIPFQIELNGKPHTITIMTLMHPSPIRMENIQHDAMLTLGDPSDGNNDGLVVLVPLQGSLMAGASGSFLNKVTRYMTSVLQPDPATGDYKTVDIPTGNDWDLSKLFPGTPENGKTYVTNVGYYVWIGYPPLQLVPSGTATPSTVKNWFANFFLREPGTQRYAWQPAQNAGLKYVMLSQPALVSSIDLQTIRMLPVTPVTEAVAPIVPWTLSYRKAGKMGANGQWESICPPKSAAASAIGDFFSGGTREGVDDTLESQCDPFASLSQTASSKDDFVKAFIVFLTACAVGVAIYLAVLFFTKTKWGQWAAHQGTLAGNYVSQAFVSDERKRLPADKRFEVTAAMEEAERKAEESKKAAEEARIKKEEDKTAETGADDKVKASLSQFKSNPAAKARRARIEKGAEEGKAVVAAEAEAGPPVRPEDVVVAPELPAPGTPAAAAVEQAGEEAAAAVPPTSVTAPVTSDVLPPPGTPAANAIEAAEPPQESRAEMFRRRAQEVAKKAREDKAAAESKVEEVATKEAEKPLTQSERAKIAEVVERREAEGKVPEDFDAERELGRPLSDEQAKKAADHAAMIAASLPEESEQDRAARVSAQTKEMLRTGFERGRQVREREAAEPPAVPRRRVRTPIDIRKQPPPPIIAKALAEKEAKQKKEEEEAKQKKEEEEEEATKRKAEEAAKSASEAAERQTAKLKAMEEERQRQAKDLAEKDKETAAREFRPTSGRSTAAVPAKEAAPPVRAPRERPPPTSDEIQTVLADVAESSKTVKSAGRALPTAPKSALSESDTKAARDTLTALRDKAFGAVTAATQAMNLRRSLWKNRSVWMRFEEEKKQSKQLASLVKTVVAYREAIESSGLDGLVRQGFANSLTELTVKTLRLLDESKRRMTTLEDDAAPPIVKGGKRRRMKRKSTRRYVA